MRIRIGICLALAAMGCNWGTRPDTFAPALGPEGAHVALHIYGEKDDRLGELITVDTAGIVIREDNDHRMIRASWSTVYELAVVDASPAEEIHRGEVMTPKKRARLALFSRYPQGIVNLPITIDSLLTQARTSTARFANRRVAVAEGYHRVGADFPGMGEHWINPNLLFAGRVDPSRPALLTYATIDGKPTLLGVGFMIVVHGDSVRQNIPGWPHAWHEHSGLLADESVARGHESHGANETHVWVMHAWTVLENPEGDFAADNWALPYLRAGLPRPQHIDIEASRALSLTIDGGAFLRGALVDAGLRNDVNAHAIDSAIATARSYAMAATRDPATANAELHGAWTKLTSDLERSAGPGVHELLEPSHGASHRGPLGVDEFYQRSMRHSP